MKAAQIAGSRTLTIVSGEMPRPAAGEVRVRVEGCGVCASSLPVWQGRLWFSYPIDAGAPGHEGWGVVDAVGDCVENVPTGTRVAFLSNKAFAEYDLAAADALVAIPDSLTRFPGEAIGCAMNIFRRSDLEAGQTVVVIGAGFLGNLLIQLARSAGARVVAVSRRDVARQLATECGADESIGFDDRATLIDHAGGAQRVIECVGSQEALDLASAVIGERGKLVIAGYHQDGPRQVNLQHWNWLGIDVVNAHERASANYVRGMREAVDAVVSGRIDPAPLLTHTYALDELGKALDDAESRPGRFVKGLVLL